MPKVPFSVFQVKGGNNDSTKKRICGVTAVIAIIIIVGELVGWFVLHAIWLNVIC